MSSGAEVGLVKPVTRGRAPVLERLCQYAAPPGKRVLCPPGHAWGWNSAHFQTASVSQVAETQLQSLSPASAGRHQLAKKEQPGSGSLPRPKEPMPPTEVGGPSLSGSEVCDCPATCMALCLPEPVPRGLEGTQNEKMGKGGPKPDPLSMGNPCRPLSILTVHFLPGSQ